MVYKEQYYYPYKDLCETGFQTIYTKDINSSNIDLYFESALNILKDGIETEEVQNMMIKVIFVDKIDVDLSIFDFVINLIFWQLRTCINRPIYSVHLFFPEDITKRYIKEYMDNVFVDKYRKKIPFLDINIIEDNVIGKFRELRPFQVWLTNSLNLRDTIDLMNKYPEFDETTRFDASKYSLEDVKDEGMKATNIQIKYIKDTKNDHCLCHSFRTGEAVSAKQYKEVAVNIGTKPDGQGSIFPVPINHSFMNGGLQKPEELCIDSSVGRIAEILQKTNVGESGAFARNLELNNQDTRLNDDPNYVCDTRNFEKITIENETMLNMYNLRYYRENPNGVDKLLISKRNKNLIGKTLYFRSPMTCASAARGQGICYKCYGDLAYSNQEVNIGQIAAEALSSIYTQILLSAKHLLESLVQKMTWTKEFYSLFSVFFNTIILIDDFNYKGWKLIIDEDMKTDEDILDDISYSYYINSFKVKSPDGEVYDIHTTESDNIYFSQEFLDYILANMPKTMSEEDEDFVMEFDMQDLTQFSSLFIMEIRNNELSRTMDQIKKLIDNKSIISQYDRDSILEAFIKTNIAGGIQLNAVHFEVLLMNQIRAVDDELSNPDWTNPNEPYQILTLTKSLNNNPSITVRLESNKVSQALRNPQNRYIRQPSITDLFFMEQPQEYLDPDIISDEFKPKSDAEENIEVPISFDNPKIRVTRKVKTKKVSRAERNNIQQ